MVQKKLKQCCIYQRCSYRTIKTIKKFLICDVFLKKMKKKTK